MNGGGGIDGVLESLDGALATLVRYDVAVGTAAVYLAYAISNWRANRTPLPRIAVVTHSALLYMFSVVLLTLLGVELANAVVHIRDNASAAARLADDGREGNETSIARALYVLSCSYAPLQRAPALLRIYALNAALKYWELLDTCVLVHRARPLMFLHVFHHACTLLLAVEHVRLETPFQWLVIALNLGVHVAMYGYYVLAALGGGRALRIWVTRLQITQFVVVLAFYSSAALASVRGDCVALPRAMASGLGVPFVYLLLFINFYTRAYVVRDAGDVKRGASSSSSSSSSS